MRLPSCILVLLIDARSRVGNNYKHLLLVPMNQRISHLLGAISVALSLSGHAGSAAALDYSPVALTFETGLNNITGPGVALSFYQGFTFDSGTFYIHPDTPANNTYLITNNALVIKRSDDKAFYFDSVDYAGRGGETREFYFIYTFADGSPQFNGASLNASDAGNFRTATTFQTELSGTDKLITSLTVVGKQTETADYSYLALDNFQFRAVPVVSNVPEPGTVTLLLAGLAVVGWMSRRRLR